MTKRTTKRVVQLRTISERELAATPGGLTAWGAAEIDLKELVSGLKSTEVTTHIDMVGM